MSHPPDYARLQIPVWKNGKPPCVEELAAELRQLADTMVEEIKPEYPPHLQALALWHRIGETNQKLSELDNLGSSD